MNGINSLTNDPLGAGVAGLLASPVSAALLFWLVWLVSGAGVALARADRDLPGGGADGTGIGWLASGLPTRTLSALRPRRDRAAGSERWESRTAFRLIGPRTGTRFTNTQPTCGTGFPPTNRPSSKSYS